MDKLFSDEQLIAFFVMGNKDAWNIFFERYRLHSINLASDAEKLYRGSGISFDEFFSLALEAISVALNKYQLYSCSFFPFWKSFVNKAFILYVKENSLTSKDNHILLSYSLDEKIYDEGHTKYEEVIGVNDSIISYQLTNRDLFNHIYKKIKLLNQKERQFLFLLLDEYDIDTISMMMSLKKKEYYRIRNKIRKKLDLDLIKDYFK